MADALITDLEITVLCDLLEGPRANLKAHKRSVLDQLLAKGLIEPAPQGGPPARFPTYCQGSAPSRGARRRTQRRLGRAACPFLSFHRPVRGGGKRRDGSLATPSPQRYESRALHYRRVPFGLAGQLDPEQGRLWLERAASQGVPEAEPEVAALAGNAARVADELEYLGRALRRLRTGSEQARPVD